MNEEQTVVKKRYYELDIMRIILMIFVIVGHSRYLDFVPYSFEDTAMNYYAGPLRYADIPVGFAYSFHMPLFFLLSGMVAFVTHEKTFSSFDKLVINKAKRLLIPYFICGLFWMIPLRVFAKVYDASNIASGIIGLFNFTDGSHLWFLPALFGAFICFYPFYLIYKKTQSLTFTFLGCYLFSLLIKLIPLSFLNFDKIVFYLPYFAAGFAVGGLIYSNGTRTKMTIFFKLSISISLSAIILIAQLHYSVYYTPLTVLVMGISIYLFSLFIAENTKFTSTKAFNTINKNCMGIYLFHDPINFPILYIAHISGFLAWRFGGELMFLLRTVGIAVLSLLLAVITSKIKVKIIEAKSKIIIPAGAIVIAAAMIGITYIAK